ncbi:MAG TPA: SH3 domain-containing protein [Novosphingobium sp.]
MSDISAPVFDFAGSQHLTAYDGHTRPEQPLGMLSLTGPGATAEAGHLPVRGDLAHIKLAGRYFVPHYAVPMPRAVAATGASLRRAGKADAETICKLPAGGIFDVLDIAGGWAWGQFGEDGHVGYVVLTELEGAA